MSRSIQMMLALIAGLMVSGAQAALVQITASADNNSGNASLNLVVPDGETVALSLLLDIGPGLPVEDPAAAITFIAGSLTWMNGGLQSYAITDAVNNGGSSQDNTLDLVVDGSGPSIGGVTVGGFSLNIGLGVNPFTTTEELFDLLVNQAVAANFLFALDLGTSGFPVFIDGNITSDISAVPVPAATWLFGTALGLLGLIRRKLR